MLCLTERNVRAIDILIVKYNFNGNKREEALYQKELSLKLLTRFCGEKELDISSLQRTSRGKPYIKDCKYKFNLSHTEGAVVLAYGEGEVGVDIEKIKDFNLKVAQKVCTQNEIDSIMNAVGEEKKEKFFSLWTFKEAFIKMLGVGLAYPMSKATLDPELSVYCVYPELKIIQYSFEDYKLCAIENYGKSSNIIFLYENDI